MVSLLRKLVHDKEQRLFFEKALTDDNFIPNPEKSEKSFFEKVKDMFS